MKAACLAAGEVRSGVMLIDRTQSATTTRAVSAYLAAWDPLSSMPGMASSGQSHQGTNNDDSDEDPMAEVNAVVASMKPDMVNYIKKGDAITDDEIAAFGGKVRVAVDLLLDVIGGSVEHEDDAGRNVKKTMRSSSSPSMAAAMAVVEGERDQILGYGYIISLSVPVWLLFYFDVVTTSMSQARRSLSYFIHSIVDMCTSTVLATR